MVAFFWGGKGGKCPHGITIFNISAHFLPHTKKRGWPWQDPLQSSLMKEKATYKSEKRGWENWRVNFPRKSWLSATYVRLFFTCTVSAHHKLHHHVCHLFFCIDMFFLPGLKLKIASVLLATTFLSSSSTCWDSEWDFSQGRGVKKIKKGKTSSSQWATY